jgi:large subunit ribosomal protein L10
MAKAERQTAVEEITAQFRESNAAVLTEYRGLTVKQLKELRRALGADTQYAVVKNTLTKRAADEAGIPGLGDLLAGSVRDRLHQGRRGRGRQGSA